MTLVFPILTLFLNRWNKAILLHSFNLINLIQASTAMVSALGVVILWRRSELRGVALLLALMAIASAVNVIEETSALREWHLISPVFIMLFGPATYLATKSAIHRELTHRDYWHFLPAIAFLVFTSHTEIIIALGTLWRLVYTYFTVSMLLEYKKQIDEQRSDSDEFSLSWLIHLVLFSVLIMLIDLIRLNIQPFISNDANVLGQGINNLCWLIISMVLTFKFSGLHGLPRIQPNQELVNDEGEGTSNDYQPIFEDLHKRILDNRWYLQPRLTLTDLSELTGLQTRDISRAINLHTNKSFNEYINTHRIEAVCEALKKGSSKSLADISLESGFNSKSSFNNVFKKNMGLTPSEYRTRLKSRDA